MLLQAGLISWLIYEQRRRSLAEVRSRNALDELANMNRLATAGQLSASIAHEINQPVTGMMLKASAALRWLAVDKPDMDRIRTVLADIVGAGERAGEIVNSVRAMFKKDAHAKVRDQSQQPDQHGTWCCCASISRRMTCGSKRSSTSSFPP